MKKFSLVILLSSLSACYEDSEMVFHQAGVYKGQQDIHKATATERKIVLAERFKQVQTDR